MRLLCDGQPLCDDVLALGEAFRAPQEIAEQEIALPGKVAGRLRKELGVRQVWPAEEFNGSTTALTGSLAGLRVVADPGRAQKDRERRAGLAIALVQERLTQEGVGQARIGWIVELRKVVRVAHALPRSRGWRLRQIGRAVAAGQTALNLIVQGRAGHAVRTRVEVGAHADCGEQGHAVPERAALPAGLLNGFESCHPASVCFRLAKIPAGRDMNHTGSPAGQRPTRFRSSISETLPIDAA